MNDIKEKLLNKFFPLFRFIKAKSDISIFRKAPNKPLSEAWERFKILLRRCPNHIFKNIAHLSIFHNDLRSNTKIILDVAVEGTMMVVDAKQAKKIIDTLASTNYQVQHDRQDGQKKRVLELSTTNALLAQNKILTYQIGALTKQTSKLSRQLYATNSPQNPNSTKDM